MSPILLGIHMSPIRRSDFVLLDLGHMYILLDFGHVYQLMIHMSFGTAGDLGHMYHWDLGHVYQRCFRWSWRDSGRNPGAFARAASVPVRDSDLAPVPELVCYLVS